MAGTPAHGYAKPDGQDYVTSRPKAARTIRITELADIGVSAPFLLGSSAITTRKVWMQKSCLSVVHRAAKAQKVATSCRDVVLSVHVSRPCSDRARVMSVDLPNTTLFFT